MDSRLLTDEEIDKAYGENLCSDGDVVTIAKAQDTKTLEAIGNWLSIRWAQYEQNTITGTYRTTFKMSDKQWESLKHGKMPGEAKEYALEEVINDTNKSY